MKTKFILLLIFTLIVTLCACDKQNVITEEHTEEKTKLILTIDNKSLCLKDNDVIVKEYDTNIAVLPSEDIIMLTNGITVNNVNEADSIAENFDG